ncbi:hypothetical protein HAX54_048495 [Datura stramonium]|uniref:Uncharacterized protein n=1 Tax=Datura stramonium TaxID=4076 RepID=A0ABS8SUF7_DATST|nr:hypothetical protein [Datura stramonium]
MAAWYELGSILFRRNFNHIVSYIFKESLHARGCERQHRLARIIGEDPNASDDEDQLAKLDSSISMDSMIVAFLETKLNFAPKYTPSEEHKQPSEKGYPTAKSHRKSSHKKVHYAIADPLCGSQISLRSKAGRRVKVYLANTWDKLQTIDKLYGLTMGSQELTNDLGINRRSTLRSLVHTTDQFCSLLYKRSSGNK